MVSATRFVSNLNKIPSEEEPSYLESSRGSRSCSSLCVVIVFILAPYIIFNIMLPYGSWFFIHNNYGNTIIYYDGRFEGKDNYTEPTTSVTTESSTSVPTTKPSVKLACEIPKLDPYDKTIKHLIKDHFPINCTKQFTMLFESHINSSITAVPKEIRKAGYESCCYKAIHRITNKDKGYKLSNECKSLTVKSSEPQNMTLNLDFMGIYCRPPKRRRSNSTASKLDIVDLHVLVTLKPAVEQRVQTYYEDLKKKDITKSKNVSEVSKDGTLLEREKVNVVILGIDGVSRMNFIRTMPKSYAFLMNNLSAIEMQGYNKIGDNTFPNMVAVLTSLSMSEVKTCEKFKTFDQCPLIWKQYASHGFRTSFGEDSAHIGIFNHLKSGFRQVPTDYYLRPFSNAADELIATNSQENTELCYGPRLSFQVLLDYMKKMAFTMGHQRRYFQLVWATSLTHDNLNAGRAGDSHLLEMLRWFKIEAHFNQTVFILMSDHGIRYGPIRSFKQGQLEERLPFLYFVLPAWFKSKHSLAVANMETNVPRLTTPYDLHETLKDLLDLTSLNSDIVEKRRVSLDNLSKTSELPRGISHFLTVPASRTCKIASVENHYCTCLNHKDISNSDLMVLQGANFVLLHINDIISKYKNCAPLFLKAIKRATIILTESGKVDGYQLILETIPGGAVFETLVERNNSRAWHVSGTISRTNLYGNQSHCVEEKQLKLFCHCLDLMSNETVTQK